MLEDSIQSWDSRRDLIIAQDAEKAVQYAADHWIHTAQRAIQQRGRFAVALSGGSTPKAVYQKLAEEHKHTIDWNKVLLFWSDERCVPPSHPDSNYKMAMDSGFSELPIPPFQIHRMKAEADPSRSAKDYDDLIRTALGPSLFDLVMLGVGEDGHTASLFPHTPVLDEEKSYCAPSFAPEKKQARMTLTYPCINRSRHAVLIALGQSKEAIVPLVLQAAIRSPFPASRIGTAEHKALWILDKPAARLLK